MLLGEKTNNMIFIISGLILIGLGYGGNPSICSATVKTLFGSAYYPINFSIATFEIIPAALIGPITSSFLLQNANGNYKSTFMMIEVLAVAGFILLFFMNREKESVKEIPCPSQMKQISQKS